MNKKINVLSLCNGIGTGNLALEIAGIKVGYYVSSEIDKYANKVAQHNYPGTLQIGDIYSVDVDKIPFRIDLVLSGTPCTSFSRAGKMEGFGAATGQLFFRFCKILQQVRKKNPNVKFLFENVASMKKEVKDIITTMLGVEPIKINSALVCAQTRSRYYWHNLGDIQQPEDRGVILQDILESDVDVKYHLSETVLKRINKDAVLKKLMQLKLKRDKSHCIMTSYARQTDQDYIKRSKGQLEQVAPIVHSLQPRMGKGSGGKGPLMRSPGNKPYCLDTSCGQAIIQLNEAKEFGGVPRQQNRVYSDADLPASLSASKAHMANVVTKLNNSQDGKDFAITGKSQCLSAGHNNVPKVAIGVVNSLGNLREVYNDKALNIDANYAKGLDNHGQRRYAAHLEDELIIRRLTPVEVCRLQSLPDNYFKDKYGNYIISESRIYHAIGNGWQADTIAHILSYMKF